MNEKQTEILLLTGIIWSMIFFGYGLHGLIISKTYPLLFLWLLFMTGVTLIIIALSKYVVIKVKVNK